MARARLLPGALLPLHAHKSGFSRGTEPIGDVHIYKEKIMLRNCLIQLWELASSTFVGQARRLEIQARVDVSVLNLMAGSSGRISVLQFGGRIPSSLGNLSLCSQGLQLIGLGPPMLWRVISSVKVN